MDEHRQRLVESRHYCTDRLGEVKGELVRLQAESGDLKVKLDGADETEAGFIRRRRRYLQRRLDELKVERTTLTLELQESTDKLKLMDARPLDDVATDAVQKAESPDDDGLLSPGR